MADNRVIDKFLKYVQIESPSGQEKDFALVVKEDLEDIGFKVTFDDSMKKTGSNTGNLIAYLPGNKDREKLMFSAHLDTVGPYEGIKPVIKDGVIYSKGDTILSSDDKSGIVAIVEGIRRVIEDDLDHGDITVVFTVCEENGLRGSSYLDYSLIDSKVAFVLDSGGDVGTIVTKGPAQTQISAKFHGKSAHAGLNPEEGINAIQVAARAIDNMNLLRIDEETTANVGIISGGSATNIVTDLVELKFECRSLNKDKLDKQLKHMIEEIQRAADDFTAKVDIEIEEKYPVFSISKDSLPVNLAKKAFKDMNIDYKIISTGGGSDTNIFNGIGIDSINLGTGMEKVHTVNEYITVDNLIKSAEMVYSIIKNA